ncbi:MAG: hypothetical protein KY429_07520 [Actinobacteria bacterium]|nr:hypothetical protein [Actinomycetota bacterium]
MSERFEDRLDEAIDLMIEGSKPRSASKGLQALLAVASEVREQLSESLSPTVRARHTRELMEAASGDVLPARRGTSWARRRILRPVAALGIAIALALPATAAAAQGAEPGDTLYGTKLAVENVQLALERDPEDSAALHLRLAERRLGEIDSATEAGKSKGLNRAVENLDEHLAEAEEGIEEVESAKTREELEAHLAEVHQKHVDVLEGLATEAGCFEGGQPISNPEGRCKGLLNALENSSKFLEGGTPGHGGENPGRGNGAGSAGQGSRPEGAGRPESTTTRGQSGNAPTPPGKGASQ